MNKKKIFFFLRKIKWMLYIIIFVLFFLESLEGFIVYLVNLALGNLITLIRILSS